jgi:hypothetical protein
MVQASQLNESSESTLWVGMETPSEVVTQVAIWLLNRGSQPDTRWSLWGIEPVRKFQWLSRVSRSAEVLLPEFTLLDCTMVFDTNEDCCIAKPLKCCMNRATSVWAYSSAKVSQQTITEFPNMCIQWLEISGYYSVLDIYKVSPKWPTRQNQSCNHRRCRSSCSARRIDQAAQWLTQASPVFWSCCCCYSNFVIFRLQSPTLSFCLHVSCCHCFRMIISLSPLPDLIFRCCN